MLIRKSFRFEGSHIVRNCVSDRCKYSIHGHSYVVEVFLISDRLDNGQMLIDFGVVKKMFFPFIDSFDHSMVFWDADDAQYIQFIQSNSKRWVSLPVSPSAEMLALVFLEVFTTILSHTKKTNNEGNVTVHSVRLHETSTGYAQAFAEDLHNALFPEIDTGQIHFSDEVRTDWPHPQWFSLAMSDGYNKLNCDCQDV